MEATDSATRGELLDQQDADPGRGDLAEGRHQPAYDDGREAERELVDDQEVRGVDDGLGDREHLLLPARQLARGPVQQGLQLGQQGEHPFAAGRLVLATSSGTAATRRLSETERLRRTRCPSGTVATPWARTCSGSSPPRSVLPMRTVPARAGRRPASASTRLDLPAPFGPEERRDLAAGHGQRHASQDVTAAAGHREVLHHEGVRQRHVLGLRAHPTSSVPRYARLTTRVLEDVGGGSVGDQPAEVEDRQVAAHVLDQVHVVVDEHHDRVRRIRQRPGSGAPGASRRPRPDRRPARRAARAAAVPTIARAISSSRRSSMLSMPAGRSRSRRPTASSTRSTSSAGRADVLDDELHVVPDRQRQHELLLLERPAQAPAGPPVWCEPVDPLACERDGPRGGLDEAAQHVEHRGLAGAVGADEPGDTRGHVERHVVQRA